MLFLLGFSMTISSCKKEVDSEFTAEFIYQNESNGDIEMTLMGEIVENEMVIQDNIKKYIISPDSNIKFEIVLPTNDKIIEKPTGILKQNNILGDSVQIKFGSGKTLMFYQDKIKNDSIYLESNYYYSQTGDYSVEYLFKFK
ncbi:MAG: hypothetical protein ACOCUV_00940 [bacterium]